MTNIGDIVIDHQVTGPVIAQARRMLREAEELSLQSRDWVIRAHPSHHLAFRQMASFHPVERYDSDELDAAKPNELGRAGGFHIVMDHKRAPGSILVMGSRTHSVTISTPRSA